MCYTDIFASPCYPDHAFHYRFSRMFHANLFRHTVLVLCCIPVWHTFFYAVHKFILQNLIIIRCNDIQDTHLKAFLKERRTWLIVRCKNNNADAIIHCPDHFKRREQFLVSVQHCGAINHELIHPLQWCYILFDIFIKILMILHVRINNHLIHRLNRVMYYLIKCTPGKIDRHSILSFLSVSILHNRTGASLPHRIQLTIHLHSRPCYTVWLCSVRLPCSYWYIIL